MPVQFIREMLRALRADRASRPAPLSFPNDVCNLGRLDRPVAASNCTQSALSYFHRLFVREAARHRSALTGPTGFGGVGALCEGQCDGSKTSLVFGVQMRVWDRLADSSFLDHGICYTGQSTGSPIVRSEEREAKPPRERGARGEG